MQEGLAKWRPALILVGATAVVIGLLVAFGGGSPSTTGPSTSYSTAAATAPSAPPVAASSATGAPSLPSVSATIANGTPAPATATSESYEHPQPSGPADPASVFVPEEHKPITAEWQAQKTEAALAAVQERSERVSKEIAELEKGGKAQEAAEKKVLLRRLGAQIVEMKSEIAQFKAQAADAGAGDGDAAK